MKVYIVNGWTSSVGQWEPEVYLSIGSARKSFDNYVKEYNAVETYSLFAESSEGNFWIEETEVQE